MSLLCYQPFNHSQDKNWNALVCGKTTSVFAHVMVHDMVKSQCRLQHAHVMEGEVDGVDYRASIFVV